MKFVDKRIKIHGDYKDSYNNPQQAQIPDPKTGKLTQKKYPVVFNEGYLVGVLVDGNIRVYLDPNVLHRKSVDGQYTIKELLEEHTDEDGEINYVDLWDRLITDSEFGHDNGWEIRLNAGDYGHLSDVPVLVGPEADRYVDDYDGDDGDYEESGWEGVWLRKQAIGMDGIWLYNRYVFHLEAEDLINRGYVEYEWFSYREPHTTFNHLFGVEDATALFSYHNMARRGEQNVFSDPDAITNAIEFAGLTGDQVIDVQAKRATQVIHVVEARIKYKGNEPITPSQMAEKIVLRITRGNSVYKHVYRVIWASDGITWFGDGK